MNDAHDMNDIMSDHTRLFQSLNKCGMIWDGIIWNDAHITHIEWIISCRMCHIISHTHTSHSMSRSIKWLCIGTSIPSHCIMTHTLHIISHTLHIIPHVLNDTDVSLYHTHWMNHCITHTIHMIPHVLNDSYTSHTLNLCKTHTFNEWYHITHTSHHTTRIKGLMSTTKD